MELLTHGQQSEFFLMMARLDRFFVCEEWAALYPNKCQIALPKPTSEHCPIILDLGNETWAPTPLRFERSWLEEDSFPFLIQQWYQRLDVHGWAGFKLARKLKNVKA